MEWVQEGHQVTVITCAPNFPQGEVYEGYRNELRQQEVMDGIKVIRVWSYITSNKGFVKRTLDYVSFAVTSFGTGLFQKADVIVATSPQFFTTWSGFLLSKLKRTPWVFELRDLWPESIKTVGALKDGPIYRTLEKIELFLYRSADLVVPVTDAFKENLVERGIPADKQRVIPNGSNLELFNSENLEDRDLRAELGLEDKFIVGYIGTHGMAHNLDFILDCAGAIEDPDIHFVFIGDGAEKEHLVAMAEEQKLENVTFMDPVPKEEVPGYLAMVDISLVPLKKSDTFKTVIPSKIFEAAAMDTPILLGVEGQAREIVEQFDAGIAFEPENQADFLEKLRLFKENSDVYNQKARNAEQLAKAYDRKKLALKMLEGLKELVGE
ncbi:MAG: glycosyltransferase family 4 protein [Balneolaceae bacterium]|nr:glycosyltransferase family 4 protein [Balneolaceae bacterium]